MEVIFILALFLNTVSRATDRIHEFYQDGKNVVFRTNDFMPLLDATKPVNLHVVFWKEGLTAPFDIATGDILVHRQIPFHTFGVELVHYGRYLIQFYQDKGCTSYTIEFHKNKVSTIEEVTAQRDCD